MFFLKWGAHNWTQYSMCVLTSESTEGQSSRLMITTDSDFSLPPFAFPLPVCSTCGLVERNLCLHPDDAGQMTHTHTRLRLEMYHQKKSWPSTKVSIKWQCPTACFWSTGGVNSSILSLLALCRCPLTWRLFWFQLPARSQTCAAEGLQRSPSAFKKWTHLVKSHQGYTGDVSWLYIIWLYLIFC